jgi:subtilisin family serine protease
MKKFLITSLCFIVAFTMKAQDTDTAMDDDAAVIEALKAAMETEEEEIKPFYRYRVYLKDKKGSPYSINRPEEYLSQKAIDRRKKQKLSIDETDLPINRTYLDKVEACGVRLINCSKWHNTVVVQTEDTTVMDKVNGLACVDSIRKVASYTSIPKPDPDRTSSVENLGGDPEEKSFFAGFHDDLIERHLTNSYKYGNAYNQIKMLNGIKLHDQGYRGQGMTIAVIDGGFQNADVIPYFKKIKILGAKDFALIGGNVYEEEEHGTMVLSCIGANCRGQIIGTAPEASFWLLRSEDGHSEQMVEEDNWCAAVEFADSVGADVVSTSLGYTEYDNKSDNVKYWELDGHTRLISKSASMGASKGMVLCQAAGNEGSFSHWKLIGAPADGEDILSVGAVNSDGQISYFSSLGNSADNRIKPDVCAQGEDCCVINKNGEITTADGTSFATPITSGMVACFWQAHPELTAKEIMALIRSFGSYASHPNNVYGYGIPDYAK